MAGIKRLHNYMKKRDAEQEQMQYATAEDVGEMAIAIAIAIARFATLTFSVANGEQSNSMCGKRW